MIWLLLYAGLAILAVSVVFILIRLFTKEDKRPFFFSAGVGIACVVTSFALFCALPTDATETGGTTDGAQQEGAQQEDSPEIQAIKQAFIDGNPSGDKVAPQVRETENGRYDIYYCILTGTDYYNDQENCRVFTHTLIDTMNEIDPEALSMVRKIEISFPAEVGSNHVALNVPDYLQSKEIGVTNATADKAAETAKRAAETKAKKIAAAKETFYEIYTAFESNEVKAKRDYKDNRYEIAGTLESIESDGLHGFGGGCTMRLFTEVDDTTAYIWAYFPESEMDAIAELSKGDEVLFEGRCENWGNWFECVLK